MIKPSDIVIQLQKELPVQSSLFHDVITPVSGVVASDILTVNSVGHGLSVGQQIYFTGVLIRNKITDVVLTSDDTLRFTTEDPHDLTAAMTARITRNWPPGESVDIENIQEYSLDETAAGVPATDMFETTSGFSLPVLSGDEYLLENRSLGVNGFQTVATVIDDDNFTVDLTTNTDAPSVADGTVILTDIITAIRVGLVPDIQRAKDIYSKQSTNQAWCFVIMTDMEVSKSLNNTDDMVSLPDSTFRELNIEQQFSTLIFLPTDETVAAPGVIDLVYVDVFASLLKSLYGWEGVGYRGGGVAEYNMSFYAQEYEWWFRNRIDFTDGWENTTSVAWKVLDFTQTILEFGDLNATPELYEES